MALLVALIDPRRHWHAYLGLFQLFGKYRELILELTKRELSERYIGQVFGTLWAIGHPLLLISIYVFVFSYVFKIRMGGTVDQPLDYTTYLLSGLIPWLVFAEAMNRATGTIVNNKSLVKQIVFPTEVLPIKSVLAVLVNQLVGTSVLVLYVLSTHRSLLSTYALLPFVLVLQFLAMVGVSYILAGVATFFRDLKDFLAVFTSIGLFVSPILYRETAVPGAYSVVLHLNPFSYMVWVYQDALYYGRFEHPWSWVIFAFFSLGAFSYGYRLFSKMKPSFGDVL